MLKEFVVLFVERQRFQHNTEQLFCGQGIVTVRFVLVDDPALRNDMLPCQRNNFLSHSEIRLSQFAVSRIHLVSPGRIFS
jgi:hypothetical protein